MDDKRDNRQDLLLDDYMTKEELAKEYNRHPRTIDRWIRLGEAPPKTRFGRGWIFNRESAKRWLAEREQEA